MNENILLSEKSLSTVPTYLSHSVSISIYPSPQLSSSTCPSTVLKARVYMCTCYPYWLTLIYQTSTTISRSKRLLREQLHSCEKPRLWASSVPNIQLVS